MRSKPLKALIPIALLSGTAWLAISSDSASVADEETGFTTDLGVEDCKFTATGRNPYFILQPGYQLVLAGEDDEGVSVRVEITVLNQIEMIRRDDLGKVKTRVVEEREFEDDELVEVSRNFFAICKRTNDVFYFGEDVDIYEDGEIVSHESAWRAGEDGAQPG